MIKSKKKSGKQKDKFWEKVMVLNIYIYNIYLCTYLPIYH